MGFQLCNKVYNIKGIPPLFQRSRIVKYTYICLIILLLAFVFFWFHHYWTDRTFIKDNMSISMKGLREDHVPVLLGVKTALRSNERLSINFSLQSNGSVKGKQRRGKYFHNRTEVNTANKASNGKYPDTQNTNTNINIKPGIVETEENTMDLNGINLTSNDSVTLDAETSTTTRSPTARQRLPQAIIIGMSKAGTRALNDFISLNSNIRATKREVHFFDRDANYSKGYGWYKAQLAYSEEGQITIERTPRYVVSYDAPERIFKMNSSIKIILIVREPLIRAVSEYVHNYADNIRYRRKTFEQYAINRESGEVNIKYKPITKSVYFHHMPKWYRYFSQDQIYIVDGDNMIINPVQELQKLERFLGVAAEITENNFYFNETKGFYCIKKLATDIPKCLRRNKGRTHPAIKPEVAKKLHDFFRPWNEKFFQQIGRRFEWP